MVNMLRQKLGKIILPRLVAGVCARERNKRCGRATATTSNSHLCAAEIELHRR